jgi:hypothetical protein
MKNITLVLLTSISFGVYGQNICAISQSVRKSINLLYEKPQLLLVDKDDACILKTLDSLYSYFKNGDTIAIRIMENVCSKSDGYLSEYFTYKTVEMFYSNPQFIILWLSKNRKASLVKSLIDGLSYKVYEKKSSELKRIKKFAVKQKKVLTAKERKLLDSIINQINPKMWE